jgi:hypothetical protein
MKVQITDCWTYLLLTVGCWPSHTEIIFWAEGSWMNGAYGSGAVILMLNTGGVSTYGSGEGRENTQSMMTGCKICLKT